MTTLTADSKLHHCKCGDPECTEMVKGVYARGHYMKMKARQASGLRLADDPDDPDEPDGDDLDEILPPELVAAIRADSPPPPPPPPPLPPAGDKPDEFPQDRPSGRMKEPKAKPTPASGQKRRVTAAVQKDVHAKIRIVLVPAAGLWAARDQYCGVTFQYQEPAISEALAEIVCDSPDLLNWFTGPAGGFMKYFKLLMALQPVALSMFAHHLAHSARLPEDAQQPPQMPAYAA